MSFRPGAGATVPMLVAAFIGAAVVALILTPVIRALVRRRGIVDAPNQRRVNTSPVPRGGGVAVVIAFIGIAGGLTLFRGSIPSMPGPAGISAGELAAVFGGGVLAVVIGAIDDLLDLRARWQLLGQLVLAGVAVVAWGSASP